MGYHAATLGTAFPTFRKNAALSSSRIKTSLTTTALRVFETPGYINRRIFTSKTSGIINYLCEDIKTLLRLVINTR